MIKELVPGTQIVYHVDDRLISWRSIMSGEPEEAIFIPAGTTGFVLQPNFLGPLPLIFIQGKLGVPTTSQNGLPYTIKLM